MKSVNQNLLQIPQNNLTKNKKREFKLPFVFYKPASQVIRWSSWGKETFTESCPINLM